MNDDMTFRIGGIEYQAGKLDAKRQFHIVRRLLPVFSGVFDEGSPDSLSDEKALGAFLKAAGEMEDDQIDYVIDNCLSIVQRHDDNIWANITVPLPGGKQALRYKDIDDMATMLTIVYHVIRGNLSGFFDALPSDFTDKLKEKASVLSK